MKSKDILNTFVYCTNCKHFELDNNNQFCKLDEFCDFGDFEDSKRLIDRPFFEEKSI